MPMEALPTHDQNGPILDAAIALLATHGITGLRHAAIDEALGLAAGTTLSRYATVRELIEAAAYRMVLLDALQLNGFRPSAAGIAAVVERRFSPEGRKHLLARLELTLYAARNPDFVTMHWARDMFAAGAEAHMRIAGASVPRLAAEAVIAIVEGLSLHDFVSPRMAPRDRFRLIRRALHGYLEASKGRDRL
jgi:DNA-binding transcriptional regulator YbjK